MKKRLCRIETERNGKFGWGSWFDIKSLKNVQQMVKNLADRRPDINFTIFEK